MYYFSYGSNMSLRRLRNRVANAQFVATARLPAHRLRFHKVGRDGSGKCDAEFSGGDADVAWGVLFRIDTTGRRVLDEVEGLGGGYDAKAVILLGDNDRRYDAFTYVATRVDPALQPYHWYKAHVVRGAIEWRLPMPYTRSIEQVASIDDPETARHRRELSIYR